MAVIGSTSGDVPINLATQIRDILKDAGGSASNDVTSFFQASAKINVWAKYKPVVAPDAFYSFADWKASKYKGFSHTCGFTIPSFSTVASFYTAIKNGTANWTYNRPTGGSTSPYRLGDFRMYNTAAEHPVGNVHTSGLIDANGYATFSVEAISSNEYSLGLGDFDLGDDILFTSYYLGVIAWNNSTYRYVTNTVPVKNGTNFTVSLQLSTAGTWNYAPFLCSVAQTGTEQSGGKYLLIGTEGSFGHKTAEFISSSATKSHTAVATWNSSRTQIVLSTIYFDNLTNASVTFSNIKVTFMKGANGASGSSIGTYSHSGSVTVPANTKGYAVSVSHTISATYDASTGFWVGVSSNQTSNGVVVWNGIDEESPQE